jgi:hypothetical protein
MASSGMLRRVALVRTHVSAEISAYKVRPLLDTANVIPSSPILVTLMKEALSSSETSVLTRAKRRNIPGDAILQKSTFITSVLRRLSLNFEVSDLYCLLCSL